MRALTTRSPACLTASRYAAWAVASLSAVRLGWSVSSRLRPDGAGRRQPLGELLGREAVAALHVRGHRHVDRARDPRHHARAPRRRARPGRRRGRARPRRRSRSVATAGNPAAATSRALPASQALGSTSGIAGDVERAQRGGAHGRTAAGRRSSCARARTADRRRRSSRPPTPTSSARGGGGARRRGRCPGGSGAGSSSGWRAPARSGRRPGPRRTCRSRPSTPPWRRARRRGRARPAGGSSSRMSTCARDLLVRHRVDHEAVEAVEAGDARSRAGVAGPSRAAPY